MQFENLKLTDDVQGVSLQTTPQMNNIEFFLLRSTLTLPMEYVDSPVNTCFLWKSITDKSNKPYRCGKSKSDNRKTV